MAAYAIGIVLVIAAGAAVVYGIARLLMWIFTRPPGNVTSTSTSKAAEAALGETTPSPKKSELETWQILFIALIFAVSVAVSLYNLRLYKKGQKTCSDLYPGSSLSARRKLEECKDRKRGNWALSSAY
jgi:hypothetical protein